MMKRQLTVVAALALMASQTACYTTRIVTARAPEGPSYTDRQWFTVGGLAGLSQPAGRNCQNGLSWAESKLSGTDWLINAGLAVAGGIAGGLACSGDSVQQTSCATVGAWLVPFLLSSRTVEYTCAAGAPAGQPWMPQQQQYMQQPPPPAQPAPAPQPAPQPGQ
jgi:hypothetical protein